MRRKIAFLIGLFLTLPTCLALAADVVALVDQPVASITVPPGSPWYAPIIAAIFPVLLGFLTWLSARASSFIATKLEEAKTSEQGKWYSMAFGLAGMGVKAAETYFGPDTGNGLRKKAHAVAWLKERLVAIDPNIIKKNPNLESLLAGLVDSAYHDVFEALAPLAPGVAKPSSQPSALLTGPQAGV